MAADSREATEGDEDGGKTSPNGTLSTAPGINDPNALLASDDVITGLYSITAGTALFVAAVSGCGRVLFSTTAVLSTLGAILDTSALLTLFTSMLLVVVVVLASVFVAISFLVTAESSTCFVASTDPGGVCSVIGVSGLLAVSSVREAVLPNEP